MEAGGDNQEVIAQLVHFFGGVDEKVLETVVTVAQRREYN